MDTVDKGKDQPQSNMFEPVLRATAVPAVIWWTFVLQTGLQRANLGDAEIRLITGNITWMTMAVFGGLVISLVIPALSLLCLADVVIPKSSLAWSVITVLIVHVVIGGLTLAFFLKL